MVRGFAKGVLLARDPFMSVWAEAQQRIEVGEIILSTTSGEQDPLAAILYNITLNYRKENLLVFDAFDKLNEFILPSNAIIVSYEALVNPNQALYDTQFSRMAVLRNVLAFAGYPDVYEEKIRCSYYFAETGLERKSIEAMNAYFLVRLSLICKMNTIFRRVLQPNVFNFTRLYSEVTC